MKGYLVLEAADGSTDISFSGQFVGPAPRVEDYLIKIDRGFGEVVFNTSMTGYQEILTDPSYYGQIICFTYPHIGNTGVNSEDVESGKVWCSGIVAHDIVEEYSNWRADKSLTEYLIENNIPALTDVDTRSLTCTIREKGAVRSILLPESAVSNAKNILKELPLFEGRDLISEVTCKKPYFWNEKGSTRFRVAAIDYGAKSNLFRIMEKLDCHIKVFPANCTPEEIIAFSPNGVFLSNGPGDPAAAPYAVETVKKLLGKYPIFGVCMGHQILSLALGAKAFKMKFGHHGANQPVFDERASRVEITSQNHGFAIDPSTLPQEVKISHRNLNDGSIEGIESKSSRAFSVQFHPEASPGPRDAEHLFGQFVRSFQL